MSKAALEPSFDALRAKLMRIAYRMLGSVADAEDVLQEAFVRWLDADRDDVRDPEAYLRQTVTRLCLDQLKSARRHREVYVGTWLPEPLVEDQLEEDVTLPLLIALERLSPLERAAFLLHDVFGIGFKEVAQTLDRDIAACRQLAKRARLHVRSARPRFEVERTRGLELAGAFFAASRSGDATTLGALLADDVKLYADGGGKRSSARKPIAGRQSVVRFLAALGNFYTRYPSSLLRIAWVNGLAGFITHEADGFPQATAIDISHERISSIYVVRNPDKLRHLH